MHNFISVVVGLPVLPSDKKSYEICIQFSLCKFQVAVFARVTVEITDDECSGGCML